MHDPVSYRLIQSVLVGQGPHEMRRGSASKHHNGVFVLFSQKMIVMKLFGNWEALFPEDLKKSFCFFFFPTSPVLRPTTTGYWTHLLQVARLTFKGTKVRIWFRFEASSGLHSWDKIYFIRFGKKWTLHPWTASLTEHIPVPHSLPPEVNERSIAHKIIEWTFPWPVKFLTNKIVSELQLTK